jgi:glycosyltransferase involved in cell wall biosynthesis
MKIGMISAWNTDSGVSVHAELIGKEWVRNKHELKVFTFIKNDFHGDGLTRNEDEDYVVRCLGTSARTNYLDPLPIITEDYYDVFVIQDLRVLPIEKISNIYPIIRKKSKIIVHILHENHLPNEPWFYQIDWDAVIYFDERQSFIENVYKNSYQIPFPCAPWRNGDKEDARRKLKLPLDKKIILIFAQRDYKPYLPDLPEHIRKDVFLLILSKRDEAIDILEAYSRSPNVEVRAEKVLSWEKFDQYAFASDAIVLHKFRNRGHAVISSTIFQMLGTGKPFLVPKHSDFFQPLTNEVLRYGNNFELGQLILEIFKNSDKVKEAIKNAKKYVDANSAQKIAEEYIRLFRKLIDG